MYVHTAPHILTAMFPEGSLCLRLSPTVCSGMSHDLLTTYTSGCYFPGATGRKWQSWDLNLDSLNAPRLFLSQCLSDIGDSCFLAILIWVWLVALLYLLGIILKVGLGV